MVRAPSVDPRSGLKKGEWSEEEDNKLRAYVQRYGHQNWRRLPKSAGLARCGKSCRLRWLNYLKPGVKRGNYSPQEEELVLKLHKEFGNKWSVIASKFRGRTDNDIKNHRHTHLRRRMKQDDSRSSKSTEATYKRSTQMDDSDHYEETSSMTTTFDSSQWVEDQMGANYNSITAADHAYSEVSSLSYDSTLFDGLLDWAAEDSMGSVKSIMEPFDDDCFWTQPFALDSSYHNNNLQQQFPASLEEEMLRPFSPYHAYSEESSLSYDSTPFHGLLDWAAEDSVGSVESIMEPFDDDSFWTQPFALDSSDNNNNLQQQFPASLVEEMLRPLSPCLDEMNVDWLHELMQ